jgi:SUMO ligase MMS21 Smc5/6 complex component
MPQIEEYLLLLSQCCELHGETLNVLATQYHSLLSSLEEKGILREADVDAKTKTLLTQSPHDELAVGLENLRDAISELKKRLRQ